MHSGGQGIYLHYITGELAQMGHEVHVIAGVPYPTVRPEVHLHKVNSFSFWSFLDSHRDFMSRTRPLEFFNPLNFYEFVSTRYNLTALLNTFSLRAYEMLNGLERERPFDLIHDNQTLGYGIWLMKRRGTPVVANIHHPLAIDQRNAVAQGRSLGAQIWAAYWYPWMMQRWVAERLDRIITGSEASAESIVTAFGLPRDRIRRIHDGVDTEVFRPLPEVQHEPGRILFVGNSDDRNKGIRYLLEALRLLRGKVPFHLRVVHRPATRIARRLVQELGLHGRVSFMEQLATNELVHQYNRAQLLVSPSLYEGFGLPAAEAQACGTPVVATTAGAFSEIVEDGATGVLVPPGEVEPLAAAIHSLLEDPERCRVMGVTGASRIRERFNWRRTAEETLALYEEVLGKQHERTALPTVAAAQ